MRWLAPILLFLVMGPARAGAPSSLPVVDFLRVEKSARTLEMWRGRPGQGGRLVHVIEGLQFGDSPRGAKRFQGDERTPEGLYSIDWGNPNSSYHLSLHISYPNAQDKAYARARGRSPGGMIMIHGQPNGWTDGRVPGDWTDGCIAVSNDEIEALWDSVPDGTPIQILP